LIARICRYGITVAFLMALFAPARGQDNRLFFKKPETVPEFFRAIQYELEVGKYDLAAEFLDGFLAKNPTDEDLIQLEEKYGISAFLRLLAIDKWVDDAKANAEFKKKAATLVERVGDVVRKNLADPKRLAKFIKNLSGTPEERAYSLAQFRKAGPYAVPPLIEELIQTKDDRELHATILDVLARLPRNALPPLLAALDMPDAQIRAELLSVLDRRADPNAVPYLWYLAGAPNQPSSLRSTARALLARLVGVVPDKLPDPKAGLVQEAERYYQHKVSFVNPDKVPVWRWEGKGLVENVVPASKAEEYFGLRFARQALDIDPAYRPAQVVFLSLALEKAYEQAGGVDRPLSSLPEVRELLTTVNPDLVYAILERGLKDRRLPVILGAVIALGDLQDVRAAGGAGQATSALVQALYYPDRRVQFAAAETLLRLPGLTEPRDRPVADGSKRAAALPAMPAKARVVEVLRRALLTDTQPKALVAYSNEDLANAVASGVRAAGFEPVVVRTGRAALRRLEEAGDIDIILLDADLPDPMLPNLIAQLRADVNAGLLPIIVTAPTEKVERTQRRQPDGRLGNVLETVRTDRVERLQAQLAPYRNVWVMPATIDPETLKRVLPERIADAVGRPLSEEERKKRAERAIDLLRTLAVGEVRGYDVRPAARAILEALRSDELARSGGIEAASRLPGREPQSALATLVLTPNRPATLREIAAKGLVRHIQQHGMLLTDAQAQALTALLPTVEEPNLKASVALVVGNLRPTAAQSGVRLRGYTPSLEVAPAKESAPAPAPKSGEEKEKKEKEKEKDQ
jgi:CheY-like chemotaxis protein